MDRAGGAADSTGLHDDEPVIPSQAFITLKGESRVTEEALRALSDTRMKNQLAEKAPRTEGVTLLDEKRILPSAIKAIEAAASQLARSSQAERHAFSDKLVKPVEDQRYGAPGSRLTPFRVDAKVDIPRYTLLGIYEGVMKTNGEAKTEQHQLLDKDSARSITLDYLFDVVAVTAPGVPHLVIDAAPVGAHGLAQRMNMGALFNSPNPGDYPNIIALNAVAAGTCANVYNTNNPSIRRVPILLLVTSRDIKKGEEGLLSYGAAYWESKEHLDATVAKVKLEKATAARSDSGDEIAAAHALAPRGAAPQAEPQDGAPAAGSQSAGAGTARREAGAERVLQVKAHPQADKGGDSDDKEDEGPGSGGRPGRRDSDDDDDDDDDCDDDDDDYVDDDDDDDDEFLISPRRLKLQPAGSLRKTRAAAAKGSAAAAGSREDEEAPEAPVMTATRRRLRKVAVTSEGAGLPLGGLGPAPPHADDNDGGFGEPGVDAPHGSIATLPSHAAPAPAAAGAAPAAAAGAAGSALTATGPDAAAAAAEWASDDEDDQLKNLNADVAKHKAVLSSAIKRQQQLVEVIEDETAEDDSDAVDVAQAKQLLVEKAKHKVTKAEAELAEAQSRKDTLVQRKRRRLYDEMLATRNELMLFKAKEARIKAKLKALDTADADA